jgi:5'-methylthioadenosine phosphorylase
MTREFTKTVALIGGTGLGAEMRRIPLTETRVHTNVPVAFGARSGRVLEYIEGFYDDLRVVLLPRHGPSRERPDRSPAMLVHELGHEAHIWLLHKIGVSAVYAFCAVGALDRDVPLASAGCFVVPDSYGRGLGATIHSFGEQAKNVHPNMCKPFCPVLRAQALAAIEAAGARAIANAILINSGPDQFETAAEVRAIRRLYDGEPHRLVGMTAGPELVLCRQTEIPYAVICANSNYAEGICEETPVSHELVVNTLKVAAEKMLDIAAQLIRIAAEAKA